MYNQFKRKKSQLHLITPPKERTPPSFAVAVYQVHACSQTFKFRFEVTASLRTRSRRSSSSPLLLFLGSFRTSIASAAVSSVFRLNGGGLVCTKNNVGTGFPKTEVTAADAMSVLKLLRDLVRKEAVT